MVSLDKFTLILCLLTISFWTTNCLVSLQDLFRRREKLINLFEPTPQRTQQLSQDLSKTKQFGIQPRITPSTTLGSSLMNYKSCREAKKECTATCMPQKPRVFCSNVYRVMATCVCVPRSPPPPTRAEALAKSFNFGSVKDDKCEAARLRCEQNCGGNADFQCSTFDVSCRCRVFASQLLPGQVPTRAASFASVQPQQTLLQRPLARRASSWTTQIRNNGNIGTYPFGISSAPTQPSQTSSQGPQTTRVENLNAQMPNVGTYPFGISSAPIQASQALLQQPQAIAIQNQNTQIPGRIGLNTQPVAISSAPLEPSRIVIQQPEVASIVTSTDWTSDENTGEFPAAISVALNGANNIVNGISTPTTSVADAMIEKSTIVEGSQNANTIEGFQPTQFLKSDADVSNNEQKQKSVNEVVIEQKSLVNELGDSSTTPHKHSDVEAESGTKLNLVQQINKVKDLDLNYQELSSLSVEQKQQRDTLISSTPNPMTTITTTSENNSLSDEVGQDQSEFTDKVLGNEEITSLQSNYIKESVNPQEQVDVGVGELDKLNGEVEKMNNQFQSSSECDTLRKQCEVVCQNKNPIFDCDKKDRAFSNVCSCEDDVTTESNLQQIPLQNK